MTDFILPVMTFSRQHKKSAPVEFKATANGTVLAVKEPQLLPSLSLPEEWRGPQSVFDLK